MERREMLKRGAVTIGAATGLTGAFGSPPQQRPGRCGG